MKNKVSNKKFNRITKQKTKLNKKSLLVTSKAKYLNYNQRNRNRCKRNKLYYQRFKKNISFISLNTKSPFLSISYYRIKNQIRAIN